MKRIAINSRTWLATKAQYEASGKIFEVGDSLLFLDDPTKSVTATVKGTYAEQLEGSGISNAGLSAVNVTATGTAAQIIGGGISSTSAAAVSYTLPTATLLGAAAFAKRGTSLEFVVDNSVGESTVTVVASAGITAATAVITGGDTLTVAAGAVGLFKIYFLNETTALIYRLG
jgi:hypothetical protein